jgi:hypothetical protein
VFSLTAAPAKENAQLALFHSRVHLSGPIEGSR